MSRSSRARSALTASLNIFSSRPSGILWRTALSAAEPPARLIERERSRPFGLPVRPAAAPREIRPPACWRPTHDQEAFDCFLGRDTGGVGRPHPSAGCRSAVAPRLQGNSPRSEPPVSAKMRPPLGIAQFLHAIGEQRWIRAVDDELTPIDLHQMLDNIRRALAFLSGERVEAREKCVVREGTQA